ncbi:MAG: complex I subunit 1 family protein [Planctomycetota bacterium]
MNAALQLLRELGLPGGAPVVILAALAATGPVVLAVLTLAGFQVYIERKVCAFMQNRIGPLHCGPQGLLQFTADGVKLLLKEDLMPAKADAFLFRLAPYVVMTAALLPLAAIPLAAALTVTDLDTGVFFVMAASAPGVIGLLVAGWASNNKWSLIGGLRTAAQVASYGVPAGLAVLSVALVAGTLNLRNIVEMQRGHLLLWNIGNPILLAAFLLYLTASVAECNRTPFDLPEAESELAAGFHTEYSGLRFGFFFAAEYTMMFVVSAVAVSLFLGGYHLPFGNSWLARHADLAGRAVLAGAHGAGAMALLAGLAIGSWAVAPTRLGFLWRAIERIPRKGVLFLGTGAAVALGVFFIAPAAGPRLVMAAGNAVGTVAGERAGTFAATLIRLPLRFASYGVPAVHLAVFLGKTLMLLFVIMWLRWTFPRMRIDRMMDLCWKRLVPAGFAIFAAAAFWLVIRSTP